MVSVCFSAWCCLLVSACLSVSTASEVAPGPPTKLDYSCPNMNCTVRWQPPVDTEEKDIRYSVKYQICHELGAGQGLIDKPECAEVTETECTLGADLVDPNKYWCVFVEAVGDKSATTSMSEAPAVIHPSNDATVDRPEILQVTATTHSIFVSWKAPETPYCAPDGAALRLDDFQVVKYSLTNWVASDYRHKHHHDVTLKRHVNLHHGILPGTIYEIELQGRINSADGSSTHIIVKTEE